MKRVLPALILLPLFSHPVRAEDPVYFADPNFKAAVEAKLWIADPTPADMLALTELIGINGGIADLTGIEYALNLETLWLGPNVFGDISPLSGLSNLRTLHLTINQIRDISPLSARSGLQILNLECNEISDISALLGLTSLEHLDLRRNPLSQEAYDVHIPQLALNNPGISFEYAPRIFHCLSASSSAGGSVKNSGAVWIDGDYHLQSQVSRWDPQAQAWGRDVATSPCIDGGDPVSPIGDEPLPNGEVVNMGTYGGATQAGKSESDF